MTDETGRMGGSADHGTPDPDAMKPASRIEAAVRAVTNREMSNPESGLEMFRNDATHALAAADAWDAEHGIVRVPTNPAHPNYETWVETIARAIFASDDGDWLMWDYECGDYLENARAVLAAIAGDAG